MIVAAMGRRNSERDRGLCHRELHLFFAVAVALVVVRTVRK